MIITVTEEQIWGFDGRRIDALGPRCDGQDFHFGWLGRDCGRRGYDWLHRRRDWRHNPIAGEFPIGGSIRSWREPCRRFNHHPRRGRCQSWYE
jgi:hypothetical protein